MIFCFHNPKVLFSTGWSKATVTNYFSLTNLKDTENGLTQSFLESWYAAVLVFRCLKITRQDKILHFRIVLKWYDGSSLVSPHKYWCAGLILLECLKIYDGVLVSDAVWVCIGVSEGESLSIWLVFWDVRTAMGSLGDIWEFNPCSMKPCWSKPTNLEQSWKQDFFPHEHFETSKYPVAF